MFAVCEMQIIIKLQGGVKDNPRYISGLHDFLEIYRNMEISISSEKTGFSEYNIVVKVLALLQ